MNFDPELTKNFLVLPPHLYAKVRRIATDSGCPNDRAYVVDSDGLVHVLKYLGPLVGDLEPQDIEPGEPEPGLESVHSYDIEEAEDAIGP